MCILTLELPEQKTASSLEEDSNLASELPSTPETSPRNHWTLLHSVDHISEQRRAQVEAIKTIVESANRGDHEKIRSTKQASYVACLPQFNICHQGVGNGPFRDLFADLCVSLDEIVPDSTDKQRVCVRNYIKGIQTRPLIPFLPVGQRTSFSLTVYIEFGYDAKPMRGTYFFSLPDPLLSILRSLPVLLPEHYLVKGVGVQSQQRSIVASGSNHCNGLLDDGQGCVEDEVSDLDINFYMARLEKLEEGNVDRSAIAWITGNALLLASKPAGSRLLQRALDVADASEQCMLVERFKGHVLQAATSLNANHVLQKMIVLLPTARSQFIIEEMCGHAAEIAQSRCGCRVFERLLEHCPSAQVACLVDEMFDQALTHCRHSYANFVIKSIFQFSSTERQRQFANAISTDIHRLARHRVANHVVRCALIHCGPSDRAHLVGELSADSKVLAELREHPHGSFVYREMRRSSQREQ